jgi:hypothetical protein
LPKVEDASTASRRKVLPQAAMHRVVVMTARLMHNTAKLRTGAGFRWRKNIRLMVVIGPLIELPNRQCLGLTA